LRDGKRVFCSRGNIPNLRAGFGKPLADWRGIYVVRKMPKLLHSKTTWMSRGEAKFKNQKGKRRTENGKRKKEKTTELHRFNGEALLFSCSSIQFIADKLA